MSSLAVIFGVDHWSRAESADYFILLFPAVGVILLLCAAYITVRRLKFGRSHLELETLPGCVGGWFAGTLRASPRLREADFIDVALRCIKRTTTGSGKERKTREDTLWEQEQALSANRLPTDRDGRCEVPVSFRIPTDCTPMTDGSYDGIFWQVYVRARVPGADYAGSFNVPVYQATQAEGFVPRAEQSAARLRASRAVVSQLDDPQIEISESAAGRKRFVFPARRNRKAAMLLSVFFLAFAAAGSFTATLEDWTLFAVIFWLIALPLGYASLLYWFRHVELLVDRHGLERQWRWLGLAGSRTIASQDVAEIRKKVTSEVNGTPYHTIMAVVGGKDVSLISNLRTRDADHVIEEITGALRSGR
jgi:hypothetical protein